MPQTQSKPVNMQTQQMKTQRVQSIAKKPVTQKQLQPTQQVQQSVQQIHKPVQQPVGQQSSEDKIYKKWWFWVAVIAVIGLIAFLFWLV